MQHSNYIVDGCSLPGIKKELYVNENSFKNNRRQLGEASFSAKLTEQQVKDIRSYYKKWSKDFGTTALASKYNIGNVAIWNIVNNLTWKHVK